MTLLFALVFLAAAPVGAAQKAAPAPHGSTHGQGQHAGELLDLNTASADDLKQLPGIEDAHAKKIVESRPYKRKDELVTKKILPLPAYDAIKDHIVAKQGTAPAK
jgi:DNA uptake protein ComE-like DNA-binding protein